VRGVSARMRRATASLYSSLTSRCASGSRKFSLCATRRIRAAAAASFNRVYGVPRVPISPAVKSRMPVL